MTNLQLFIAFIAKFYIVWLPLAIVAFIFLLVKISEELKWWRK